VEVAKHFKSEIEVVAQSYLAEIPDALKTAFHYLSFMWRLFHHEQY
jgi:hypothetical protein